MHFKITKDILMAAFGEFFYVASMYSTNVLFSRFLGAYGVGVYAQAMAIVLFISVFARLGLDLGILRFLSFYLANHDFSYVKGIIRYVSVLVLLLSVALGSVVFITAPGLAVDIFNDPQLTFILRIFILTIPFFALTSIWLYSVQAFQRTDLRVIISKVIVPVTTLGTMFIFLHLGWQWYGVLSSVLLATTIGTLLAYYVLYRVQKFYPRIVTAEPKFAAKEWFIFSYPLCLSELLVLALARGTILMLGYFQPSVEVGIYDIALKIALLVRMPLDISNLILAPVIGELYSQGNWSKLGTLFKVSTKWLFALSILVFLIINLLANSILIIFGSEFVTGLAALRVLSLGYLINVSTGSVGWMLIVSGHTKIHLLNSTTALLLTLILGFLLIPGYGFMGAAIAVCSTEIIINVVRLIQVFFLLKIHPYRWDFMKPVIAGLITLSIVYLLQQNFFYEPYPMLWISIIIAGLIFVLYLMLLVLLHWSQIKEPQSLLL